MNYKKWLIKRCKKHNLKISPLKTKAVGLYGENIQRVQLETDRIVVKQVSNFNSFGNLISAEEKDVDIKVPTMAHLKVMR